MLTYIEFRKLYAKRCKRLGLTYDRKELSRLWEEHKTSETPQEIIEEGVFIKEEIQPTSKKKAGMYAEQPGIPEELKGANAENR